MELEEAILELIKIKTDNVRLLFPLNELPCFEGCRQMIEEQNKELEKQNKAIETVLQALDNKDKQLQEISDEFLKYDLTNSNSIQINNQLKSLYFSIFKKEKMEE